MTLNQRALQILSKYLSHAFVHTAHVYLLRKYYFKVFKSNNHKKELFWNCKYIFIWTQGRDAHCSQQREIFMKISVMYQLNSFCFQVSEDFKIEKKVKLYGPFNFHLFIVPLVYSQQRSKYVYYQITISLKELVYWGEKKKPDR